MFRLKDWVYVHKPPVDNQIEAYLAAKDSSRKLAPKKGGLYQVVSLQNHTLSVDIGEIHNVVSIDGVIFVRARQEDEVATGSPQAEQDDEKAISEIRSTSDDESVDHSH